MFGHYCAALFRSPPDVAVCSKDKLKQKLFDQNGVVLADFIYKRVPNSNPIKFLQGKNAI